jgi:3-dehydroquinate synthase
MSKIRFYKDFPKASWLGEETLLIYDRRLLSAVPGFSSWVKEFDATYAVSAGEKLKDIRAFAKHCEAILKLTADFSARRLTVVAAGGGSVGDFAGFLASVFKRGVRLVHLPTTWLAAIDSAHGGKTALNVQGGKNQIGTFYPAAEVVLIERVLASLPAARAMEACGELGKIALISGGSWVKNLESQKSDGKTVDSRKLLKRHLLDAIKAKNVIVRRDPFEKKGERQILNLGHTLGHVLEADLGLAHGAAVAQGTFFALEWSLHRGYISAKEHRRATDLLELTLELQPLNQTARYKKMRPSSSEARRLLMLDKKRDSRGRVVFIFLRKIGRAFREEVSIDELLAEARRQNWIG